MLKELTKLSEDIYGLLIIDHSEKSYKERAEILVKAGAFRYARLFDIQQQNDLDDFHGSFKFIPINREKTYVSKLKALCKKLRKYDNSPIVITYYGERTWKQNNEFGEKEILSEYILNIVSPSYSLGDYVFQALLTKLNEDTNLIKSHPNNDLSLNEFEECEHYDLSLCDHCNRGHRRNSIIVVRNKTTNKLGFVGRKCARDYLSGIDPESTLVCLAMQNNDDFGQPSGGKVNGFDSLTFLRFAKEDINERGFVSKGMAFKDQLKSTAEYCLEQIDKKKQSPEKYDEYLHKVITYWRNSDGQSDYERNLRNLLQQDYCTNKHAGFIASAISGYERAIIRLEKLSQEKEEDNGNWSKAIGELKSKPTLIITVTGKYYDQNWGGLYVFGVTKEGFNIKAKVPRLYYTITNDVFDSTEDIERGHVLVINGTLTKTYKGYNTYKKREDLTNYLTRVKVLGIINPDMKEGFRVCSYNEKEM